MPIEVLPQEPSGPSYCNPADDCRVPLSKVSVYLFDTV